MEAPGGSRYTRASQAGPNSEADPFRTSRGIVMKKGGILNPAICSLLAELGHMDELLIVDAGYSAARPTVT